MCSTWQRALRPWSDPLGSLCITLHVPRGASGKEPALPMQETQGMSVRSLGGEDPLEEGTAIHSSILACRIPWTEEPGRLHTVHEVAKSRTQLKRLSMQAHSCSFGEVGPHQDPNTGSSHIPKPDQRKKGLFGFQGYLICLRQMLFRSDLSKHQSGLKMPQEGDTVIFFFLFFFWTWDLGWFSGSKSQNKFHTFRW